MKARDLLDAVKRFSVGTGGPSDVLREVTDDQLKSMLLVAAELFATLKAEAIRRGTWDAVKKEKVRP